MVKARVLRPCYVRGVQKVENEVVDLTHQEFNEMKTTNYVVKHEEPEAAVPAVAAVVPEPESAKKGK